VTSGVFRHPDEAFTAVQWTGSNLDEIAEFAGFAPATVGGLLTVPLSGGEVSVMQVGWWMYRDSQGLGVASAGAAARWVPASG
jgi:hypothetical protein